jgi:hypothetical protein
MTKTTVLLGPRAKRASVASAEFLPGLVVHENTNPGDVGSGLTVTHAPSGYSILQSVPAELLDTVKECIRGQDWALDAKTIFNSRLHEDVVNTARLAVYSNKDLSKRQEERLAKDLGEKLGESKVQPGSGNRWGYRRDVITSEYLIEAKTTGKNTWSVSCADLNKLKTQAYSTGLVPAYIVEFQEDGELVLLPLHEINESFIEKGKVLMPKGKRSFSVTRAMLSEDRAPIVKSSVGLWVVLPYFKFLRVAKELVS